MTDKLEEYRRYIVLIVSYVVKKAISGRIYKLENIKGMKDEVNWNAAMSTYSNLQEAERCKWILWKTQGIICL